MLNKFLFLIDQRTTELGTNLDEDKENIELIQSFIQCGGHVADVCFNN